MFTGIVQNLGVVHSVTEENDLRQFQITSHLDPSCFKSGNSIAVDGVCLTVEKWSSEEQLFTVSAVPETLKKTTLGHFKVGDLVNLEPALKLNDFLGGHLVSGHVDFVAMVTQTPPELSLEFPLEYEKYFAQKGSATVNGVSLTVVSVEGNRLKFALIPETLKETNLGALSVGDFVNLEIDLLARYIERLLPRS